MASMWHRCGIDVDRCGIDVDIDVASMWHRCGSMWHRWGSDVASMWIIDVASMWIDVKLMWHRCGIDVWHRCLDRCDIDVDRCRIDMTSMYGIDVASVMDRWRAQYGSKEKEVEKI